MSDTPEIIYLIHGEYEGEHCRVWCDDPAPSSYNDPAEAVKYVRADIHESALKRQGNAAKMGMDAAKKDAIWREENAKRLLVESNPAAIEGERAMNAELTSEVEGLQARVAELEKTEAEYWWKLGMANARQLIKSKRVTSNAVLFMNLFGTGFGTANHRCRQIGLDPDGNETSLSSMTPLRNEAAKAGGVS